MKHYMQIHRMTLVHLQALTLTRKFPGLSLPKAEWLVYCHANVIYIRQMKFE